MSGPTTPSMPRRWCTRPTCASVGDQHFEGRAHFFAAAAEAMRRVLVDHSRNRARLKRGGGTSRIDLDKLTDPASATDDDLLALDDAIDRLASKYPRGRRGREAAVLCRDDPERGGGGLAALAPDRQPSLGVCAGLAGRRPRPRVIRKEIRDRVARFRSGRSIVSRNPIPEVTRCRAPIPS